jgi:hypothetical protein
MNSYVVTVIVNVTTANAAEADAAVYMSLRNIEENDGIDDWHISEIEQVENAEDEEADERQRVNRDATAGPVA